MSVHTHKLNSTKQNINLRQHYALLLCPINVELVLYAQLKRATIGINMHYNLYEKLVLLVVVVVVVVMKMMFVLLTKSAIDYLYSNIVIVAAVVAVRACV
jgi:hypothetical protein